MYYTCLPRGLHRGIRGRRASGGTPRHQLCCHPDDRVLTKDRLQNPVSPRRAGVRVASPLCPGGAVEPIWKKHWPATVDEKSIRLPEELLPATLARQAKRVPDRPAIHFYGRAISFAELDSAVGRFAGFLQGRGISPGDRVAIFLENSPQFAIAYYGALRAGAIVVALNAMHKAVELLHEFEDSGALALVTSDLAYDVVEPIRAQTKLATVVLTAYCDFLPEKPSQPPPPSFLATRGGQRPAGTDALVDVLGTTPELKMQVPRTLSDTALLQYTSGTTGI